MWKRTKKFQKRKTLQSSQPKIIYNTNELDNISNIGNLKDDDNSMYTDSNNNESYKLHDDELLNTNDNESNKKLTDLCKKVYQR